MKAVIESTFKVRDSQVTNYHSFPKFSDNIEPAIVSQLSFLERVGEPYTLSLTIKKG